MITANRRARATIAFFIPRCLAIFIAQALSQDHLAECTSMLWAAFGRPCRQCDCRFKRLYELTSSVVPRGTSFHRGVELDFLLLHLILHRSQAAATSLVHRNSAPSTQMRCMTTANRRASATIAFFIPRCLAIFIAQALSQDHLAECTSMLWAAS